MRCSILAQLMRNRGIMVTARKRNPKHGNFAGQESGEPPDGGIISSNSDAPFSNRVAIRPDLLRQMGNRPGDATNSAQYGHIVARQADYSALTPN